MQEKPDRVSRNKIRKILHSRLLFPILSLVDPGFSHASGKAQRYLGEDGRYCCHQALTNETGPAWPAIPPATHKQPRPLAELHSHVLSVRSLSKILGFLQEVICHPDAELYKSELSLVPPSEHVMGEPGSGPQKFRSSEQESIIHPFTYKC